MRIGIDVRYLSHGLVGGVHHYIAQLVPALLEAAPDKEFVLYADRRRPIELTALSRSATLRLLPWRSPLSSIVNDLTMPRWMGVDRLDVAHFPANYGFGPSGIPKVVTIHDAINLLPLREIVRGHPKNPRTVLMMTYLHCATRDSLNRAVRVVTPSHDAARRITETRRLANPSVLRVVAHGLDAGWRRVTDSARLQDGRRRFGLTRRIILADATKNASVLLRAWRMLPANLQGECQIVFFSRSEALPATVRRAVGLRAATVVFRPSREELNVLFSLAEVFVFPSWIEGFGLPVLEAMACGTPVIASDRGSIPEVADDAALMADAEDAAAFAEHLKRVLADPAVADELRARGTRRAAAFSWDKTARGVLEVYAEARMVYRPTISDSRKPA